VDQEAIRVIGWNRFAELLQRPLSGGIRRDINVKESAAGVFNHDEHIEDSECRRDRHTEVTRHDAFGLVAG
jgi:hypothetical protein